MTACHDGCHDEETSIVPRRLLQVWPYRFQTFGLVNVYLEASSLDWEMGRGVDCQCSSDEVLTWSDASHD